MQHSGAGAACAGPTGIAACSYHVWCTSKVAVCLDIRGLLCLSVVGMLQLYCLYK
jgi:hypothetical protein